METENETDEMREARWRQARLDGIEKCRGTARAIGDLVNSMCFENSEEEDAFIEELTLRTHRTLQQSAFKLFIRCLCAWGDRKDKGAGWYDARNEDTVNISAEVRKFLEEKGHIFKGARGEWRVAARFI